MVGPASQLFGQEYQVQLKYEYTDHPSIQGPWNPFTNVDPAKAIVKHPDAQSLETWTPELSATERIKQMFAEQKAKSQSEDVDHRIDVQGKD